MDIESNVFQTILSILNSPTIQYPLALACIAIGAIVLGIFLINSYKSYKAAKKEGKKVSILRLFEDIHWTMYDWNDRDQEYVMSLPRLIYFISAMLIVFVVIMDRSAMLAPLLGFNLSSAAAYGSKKYVESKSAIAKSSELIHDKVEDVGNLISTLTTADDLKNSLKVDSSEENLYDE